MFVLCAATLLWLTACTVQPVTRPAGDVQNTANRAEAEAQRGNLAVAAQLYEQLASSVTGTLRSRYLVEASRLHLERGDSVAARQLLTEARGGADREQQQTIVTMLARIELDEGRAQAALDTLRSLQQPISVPVLREVAAVRARALFRLRRHGEAVAVLVEREVWLDNAAEILANQRMIWDGLAESGGASAPTPTGDRIVDGWLALAPLAATGRDVTELRRELLSWRETYTDHPAAGGLLAELLSAQRARGFPAQIALLLPLGSSQRDAAIAVRDGFLAAHLSNAGGDESRIAVYDTGTLGSQEAYLRAQLEGAEFIVGPLLRPDVEEVIAQSGFVPTLALNFAQTETPFLRSFYQFAPAPEDEARTLARFAIGTGASTSIALIPSSDRGYRWLNSFREEFEAFGGRLLDFTGYDPNAQDFSTQIRSLLNITRSEQRRTRLQANLGVPIGFEPRRREDVDMIFLAADARAGRLLAPQLRFRGAGNIPIYATSDIYEPGNPAGDSDLNGVMFTDVPWTIEPEGATGSLTREFRTHWPRRASSSLIRLYGMGFDAYGLMQSLYDESRANWPLESASGQLVLDSDGRIHRSFALAQFRNGRPVPLETPVAERPAPAERPAAERPVAERPVAERPRAEFEELAGFR